MWLSVVLPILGGLCALTRFYVDRRAGVIANAMADARLATVEEQTRPRGFTEAEVESLRRALVRVQEPLAIEIATPEPRKPFTDVAELVAKQLGDLFAERGWSTTYTHTSGLPPRGINRYMVVKGQNAPELPVSMQAFVDAFAQLRLHGGGTNDFDPSISTSKVRLVIATNPF